MVPFVKRDAWFEMYEHGHPVDGMTQPLRAEHGSSIISYSIVSAASEMQTNPTEELVFKSKNPTRSSGKRTIRVTVTDCWHLLQK
jgi:hypothetical protein